MTSAEDIAKRMSAEASHLASLIGIDEASLSARMQGMHLVASAVWESKHADAYLRARLILLEAISTNNRRPNEDLQARLEVLDDLINTLHATLCQE